MTENNTGIDFKNIKSFCKEKSNNIHQEKRNKQGI